MRFGIALPQYDYSLPGEQRIDWPGVRDWAKRAEELGFDSAWVSDHLFSDVSKYGGPSGAWGVMECFTTLAAVAATTEKIRLGSLVACNDLRSPALLAKMVATLDALSKGRIEVGIGAGWFEPEYQAAGIPFDPPGVRIKRLGEAVQIVKGMLSSESFSFTGSYYKVKEAWNLPRSVQSPRPTVWVGGKGDRVAATAGRYADGYNAAWAWTPESYGDRIHRLEEGARAGGRDPSSVRKSVGLYCLPGSNRAEVEKRWQKYVEAGRGVFPGTDFAEWKIDKLCGTPEEILRRIDEFSRLGVEEVILSFGILPFTIADREAVELFAQEVIARGAK